MDELQLPAQNDDAIAYGPLWRNNEMATTNLDYASLFAKNAPRVSALGWISDLQLRRRP